MCTPAIIYWWWIPSVAKINEIWNEWELLLYIYHNLLIISFPFSISQNIWKYLSVSPVKSTGKNVHKFKMFMNVNWNCYWKKMFVLKNWGTLVVVHYSLLWMLPFKLYEILLKWIHYHFILYSHYKSTGAWLSIKTWNRFLFRNAKTDEKGDVARNDCVVDENINFILDESSFYPFILYYFVFVMGVFSRRSFPSQWNDTKNSQKIQFPNILTLANGNRQAHNDEITHFFLFFFHLYFHDFMEMTTFTSH